MKTNVLLWINLTVALFSFGQENPSTEKEKDTLIKTEVVEIITSYAPKVTDAFKIKRKPVIQLSKEAQKKALDYTIQSVPVASTFVPKSGTMKKITIAKKELIFNNFIAVGFGNNTTPFFEGCIHKNTPFDSEYAISTQFMMSIDPVKNTPLSSRYYNGHIDGFYKQEERYFTWKAGFDIDRNQYHWYGLPKNINFTEAVLSNIEPEQTYKNYGIFGELHFPDSYIKNSNTAISYFSDSFDSAELYANLEALFSFPIGRFGMALDDVHLNTQLNFLGSGFERSDTNIQSKTYQFVTAGVHPYYQFQYAEFDIKLGAKGYFSMNLKDNQPRFFVYPDIKLSYPIIPKIANLYAGVGGDLHTNSYKKFADQNPFIAPTIHLEQTNEIWSAFSGLKGIAGSNINYNITGRFSKQENKPFFNLYQSQSDGTTTGSITTGFDYQPYEYGNSFRVVYDEVSVLELHGEVEYDTNQNINVGVSGKYAQYTLTQQKEAWNVPQLTAEVFGKYQTDKWYAGTTVYYVSERKGIVYEPNTRKIENLNGYIDVNLNGGYHFNSLLSAFVKANNIASSNYQRFTNFNAQGIQVIGGIIWKFD